MKNAINKYGWKNIKHKIVATNLTKEEAEKLEIYLINKKYKSNNRKYGYNIEYGGCHNGKTSEEAKKRMSKERKGKHVSIKTEFKKGHKPLNAKAVLCVETNIIYSNMKEASKNTNAMASHISEVCKGKRKSAGKLHWKYVLD